MAIAIPASIKKVYSWRSPNGKHSGTFVVDRINPVFAYKKGAKRFSTRRNPEDWVDRGPTYSGNLFVGFSVGNKPKWKMMDLVKLVKKVRAQQVGRPDSSFVYQKGVYTHQSNGVVVTENAAQVIIMNVDIMKRKRSVFRADMSALAETVCRQFHQEMVLLRIDRNGVAQETVGIIGEPKKEKKAKKAKSA